MGPVRVDCAFTALGKHGAIGGAPMPPSGGRCLFACAKERQEGTRAEGEAKNPGDMQRGNSRFFKKGFPKWASVTYRDLLGGGMSPVSSSPSLGSLSARHTVSAQVAEETGSHWGTVELQAQRARAGSHNNL